MQGSRCWRPGSDTTLGLGVIEAPASLKEENIRDVKSPPSAERSLISFSAGGRISSERTENIPAGKRPLLGTLPSVRGKNSHQNGSHFHRLRPALPRLRPLKGL